MEIYLYYRRIKFNLQIINGRLNLADIQHFKTLFPYTHIKDAFYHGIIISCEKYDHMEMENHYLDMKEGKI